MQPSPISPIGGPSHNPISPSEPSPTSSWPRRVSKACCSCRRDKIRCDGTRPCSGCLKKGLPADKCIDGCLPCRRSRARCDGGNPCTKCQESGIDCVDEQAALPTKLEPLLKSPVQPARAKTVERAKLACQACRRDNKKCDDKRPCSRCQTRKEECVHVIRGPKQVKLRCTGCRRENRKCEDSRPCRFCKDSGEECLDEPRKGRGHGTRVKAACVNCRRDKIQCENDRPCRGCVRRGYVCIDRTCQCAEKGPGQECNICRAQKQKAAAMAAAASSSTTTSTQTNGHDNTREHVQGTLPQTQPQPPHIQQQDHQRHPIQHAPPPPGVMHQAFPIMGPYPVLGPGGIPVPVNVQTYGQGRPMALPIPIQDNGYYPVIDPSIDERNTRAIPS